MVQWRTNRRLALLAAACFLVSSCANQVVLGPGLLHAPPPEIPAPDLTREPQLVWSFKLPAEPAGGMASFGRVLAVPTKNRSVWFVDKESGKKLAVYDLSGVPAGVVFDGRENLLIAEQSGNGELLSYSLVDGGVDWRFALNEAWEVPIVGRGETDRTGTVLAASRAGWVYALRADDGKPLWNLELGLLSCPPAAAESIFYLADFEGELHAVANGKVVFSRKEPAAILALEFSGTELFAGGGDSSLSCFSAADGKPRWRFKTDGKVRSLAVSDTLVFCASTTGTVSACSISNGQKRWERKLEGLVSGPLLAAGGAVFAGTAEGRFFALSQSEGGILWERRIPGTAVGRPVLEGNTLYLATTGRRVLAFRF